MSELVCFVCGDRYDLDPNDIIECDCYYLFCSEECLIDHIERGNCVVEEVD